MRDATSFATGHCRFRRNFNPRIPCGMRHKDILKNTTAPEFQSTHPMRDATPGYRTLHVKGRISIHASHAGCDQTLIAQDISLERFQSTHPMRDATYKAEKERIAEKFQSTHPMRDATATYSECLIKVAKYSPFAQLI